MYWSYWCQVTASNTGPAFLRNLENQISISVNCSIKTNSFHREHSSTFYTCIIVDIQNMTYYIKYSYFNINKE